MILHDPEADEAFSDLIDAGFPYNGPAATSLIRRGWAISLNAAFCVLHELCRPPLGCGVTTTRLGELAEEWADVADHPLKAPVLSAARVLIEGRLVPWPDGISLMKRVGEFDGQRAALAIAYMASDEVDEEAAEALARTEAAVRQHWEARGV